MENNEIKDILQKMRVLVVDDVAADRLLLRGFLNAIGVKEVIEAHDVKEAIFKIVNAVQIKKPFHLIFSDWMMPGTTGLQFLEKLRSDERSKDIPLVMITGVSDKDSVVQSISAGVTDFVIKPVTGEQLEKKIRGLIEQGKIH